MRLERVVGSTCRSNSSQHIPDIFLLHATGSTERRCRRVSNSVPSELKWEACLTFRRRRCDRRWGEIGRGRSDLTSRRDKPWRGLICLVTDWAMVRLYVLLPTEPWRGLICIVTDWAMVRLYVLLPTEPWYGCMYCYRPSHGTAVCIVTDRATVLLYVLLPTEPRYCSICPVTAALVLLTLPNAFCDLPLSQIFASRSKVPCKT